MESKKIEITMTVDGTEMVLTFDVGLTDYNRFLNATNPKDKISPAHNFVWAVFVGDKSVIDPLLKLPGMGLQLTGEIIEEYMPQVEFISKKSKSLPTA